MNKTILDITFKDIDENKSYDLNKITRNLTYLKNHFALLQNNNDLLFYQIKFNNFFDLIYGEINNLNPTYTIQELCDSYLMIDKTSNTIVYFDWWIYLNTFDFTKKDNFDLVDDLKQHSYKYGINFTNLDIIKKLQKYVNADCTKLDTTQLHSFNFINWKKISDIKRGSFTYEINFSHLFKDYFLNKQKTTLIVPLKQWTLPEILNYNVDIIISCKDVLDFGIFRWIYQDIFNIINKGWYFSSDHWLTLLTNQMIYEQTISISFKQFLEIKYLDNEFKVILNKK